MLLSCGLAHAGIVCTSLTTPFGQSGASTTLVSPSVTASANRIVFFSVWSSLLSGNGPGPISTVTGAGLTWHNLASASIDYDDVEGTANSKRLEIWYSMGSPSAGAVTATWATSPTVAAGALSQCNGVSTTGLAGAGAIGHVATANTGITAPSGPSSVALTFSSPSNGTFSVIGPISNPTMTAGTGLTVLGTRTLPTITDEYAANNVTTVQFNYTGTSVWGQAAIELVAPTGSSHRPLSIQ